jgi:protein dithiol oxidoreductase (disulfide-forming)
MTLDRREFSRCLFVAGAAGAAGAAVLAPAAARAEASISEGVQYVRLAEEVPVAVPGKIEVIEFFWYECPHCNAFEPALEAWSGRVPDDVAFRRVPVWFREEPFTIQQRLYYTLEALGLVPTLHRKVFAAIHRERVRMRTPEDLTAFALKNGIDPLKFIAAFNSFSVQSKSLQARRVAAAYKIDAVPAMGVNGRYYTNGNLANAGASSGSNDRMLAVVDALIAKVRQAARG